MRRLWEFSANLAPFAIIWLAAGGETVAAALAAFLMTLAHCRIENRYWKMRFAKMANELKERENA